MRLALNAIVTLAILGATLAMIFTGTDMPEWWPAVAVAVVSYTLGIQVNGRLPPRGP